MKVEGQGKIIFKGCGVIGSAVVSTGRDSIPLSSTHHKKVKG